MSKKSLVSISDYSKDEILSILESAAGFEANPNRKTLDGKENAKLYI